MNEIHPKFFPFIGPGSNIWHVQLRRRPNDRRIRGSSILDTSMDLAMDDDHVASHTAHMAAPNIYACDHQRSTGSVMGPI